MIAVLTLDAMVIALVAVFTLAPVNAKATFPIEWVVVVEEVIDNRGRRVVAVLVVSRVAKDRRARTDVPPMTIADTFPVHATSNRSHSTSPTFVWMTGRVPAAFVCCISTFVRYTRISAEVAVE
jgi:hypothetical protein